MVATKVTVSNYTLLQTPNLIVNRVDLEVSTKASRAASYLYLKWQNSTVVGVKWPLAERLVLLLSPQVLAPRTTSHLDFG